jgi:hypothetical protein
MSNTNQLQPHQQRVVDEKTELDTKATALSKFIGESAIFPTLDAAEQERLKEQCEVMWEYSEILGARIAAFGSVDGTEMLSKPHGIRVSIEQMAKAFEAWENGYRADPQKFMTADEVAAGEVSQLSADRAAYFHELLTTAVGA